MTDQFVAEIRVFPFNVVPSGWAQCNGQLMPISQNTALFSLLGTTYGGDGKSTFGLPNLQNMVPIQQGSAPGLSDRFLGEQSGTPTVTLVQSEIPVHGHTINVDSFDPSDLTVGNPQRVLAQSSGVAAYQPATTGLVPMSLQALTPAGSGLPHSNMQPTVTLNYCIALQGIFPPRS